MKTKSILLFVILFLTVFTAHAGTGNAYDGLIFTAILTGILLGLVIIFYLIDFFKDNTGLILERIVSWYHFIVTKIREFINNKLSPFILRNAH